MRKWLALVCIIFSSSILAKDVCPEFPFFRPKEGPLAVMNCDLHKIYEQRLDEIMKTFGAPGGIPVILNLGGKLVLKYNGKTEVGDVTPDQYHTIKAFNHQVFAVFLTLINFPSQQISEEYLAKLRRLKEDMLVAAKQSPKTYEAVTLVTTHFLQRIIEQREVTAADIKVFKREIKPWLYGLMYDAARTEIQAFEKILNPWLANISLLERNKIAFVVATSHQAAWRELSLQYLTRKLGIAYTPGTLHENRYVVLEGKFDEPSALSLLGRHYLDKMVSDMIFDNPTVLQEDLLAQDAFDYLQSHIEVKFVDRKL